MRILRHFSSVNNIILSDYVVVQLILPFVQIGIFRCSMFIIMYFHTPEQKEIPICTKGKIGPQQQSSSLDNNYTENSKCEPLCQVNSRETN